ncbi:MAG: bifunctional phosphoglucose/phosphomannose isomerase [bacterium]|nr:bifunctional phosphoglucose/phosphomannose isomerase [bacterium]
MKLVIKVDKSNLRQVILDFPKQFRAGMYAVERITLAPRQLRSPIVICGMGGSASVGELLKLWMRHEYLGASEFAVIIHRGYGLPKLERREYSEGVWEPLVVPISYSGNTEETLSAYEDAKKKGLPVVAISTGGTLQKFALKDKTPFILLPKVGIQPRSSFGYQFGALTTLLLRLEVLHFKPHAVSDLGTALHAKKWEAEGKKLAKKLQGTTPLLYASDAWKELAYIIKIKFNEHAKTPAFWNHFPELNHNEMTGFAEKDPSQKYHALIFRDKADHPRVQKRMKLTAALLAKKGIKSTFVPIEGKTVLEKIFSTLLLGDWMAYYHAILRGIDPTPVKMVEEFKKSMR